MGEARIHGPELGGPSLQVDGDARPREEERKVVTIVFADLSGSTALAERLDPEDTRRILTAFFNALSSEIVRFGGTIDKYAGDAVMAVFGAPVAHEDDAIRALRTSLAMQEVIARLSDDLERERSIRLSLRVGVNTGLVAAGSMSGSQRVYTVVGDAVNTAQRLESAAGAGGILVGAATRRLGTRAFEFEPVEPLRVKGKAEPLVAFRLLGPRIEAPALLRSAMVGRDAELAVLLAAVGDVGRGEGRIALVTGEPGIGKSRLLAEVRRGSVERGVAVLEGRALSMAQGISYLPFIEILKSDAAISEDEAPASSWHRLERRITTLFPDEVSEVLPYLASLVGVDVPTPMAERVRHLDAQAMGLKVFATARRYFARLARDRPLVLVFEDWHWADGSSIALLEHLLPLVNTEPVGICVTGRTGEPGTAALRLREAALSYSNRLVDLRLAPLRPEETGRLAEELLESTDLPPDIRARVLDRTEGNPLFVEEIVRALIDLGGIARDPASGGWRATERLDRISLPDNVHGVIVARIDRLDEDVKQVLKLASVIGRSFLYRVLHALDDAAGLETSLDVLQDLELIRERGRVPELEYAFKHALVHDAAYESLLLQRRRELHGRVGDVIESLFRDRLDEFSGVLAYHFARAERWDKAQAYLVAAGDRSQRAAGGAEALTYYSQAIAAYARAFGDKWDAVQHATIERKMAEAYMRLGDYKRARESSERCLALLGLPVSRTRGGIRIAILGEALRQLGHRTAPGLFLRRRHDPVPEVWTRVGEGMIWTDFFFGESERLVLDALRLLNLAEANNYRAAVPYGASALGMVCDALRLTGIADRYHRRAVAVADELGDPLAIGVAYHTLAIHEGHALGETGRAVEHYRRAIDAYRAAGDEARALLSAVGLAGEQRLRGELPPDEEIALGRHVRRAGEDGGNRQMQAWGGVVLGIGLLDKGELGAAEEELRRANQLLRSVPDYAVLMISQGYLMRCLLRSARVDEAIELGEEAARILDQRRMRTYHPTQARNALVQAYLAAAERGERDRFLAKVRKASDVSLSHGKLDREALPGAYRWRGSYEWLRGDVKAARKWWDRSEAAAAQIGGKLDLEITRQERSRLTSSSSVGIG